MFKKEEAMRFIHNFKISHVLTMTGGVVVIGVIIGTLISSLSLGSVRKNLHENRTEVAVQVDRFIELKISVIQVQQWLTDISATRAAPGYDDGFDEAKKYFEKSLNLDPNREKTYQHYGELLLKLNQHSKALEYLRKGTGFIRFTQKDFKII